MDTTDQSEVIDFLSRPETYGGDEPVEVIETHISEVFLVGDRVFKLKRAVSYPYLDFSTIELRHRYCLAEVAINRRTAPDLYKGVVAVTRDGDSGLVLGGDGEPVDWLVEMARFEASGLFERMAVEGRLDGKIMGDLADAIAAFHMAAEPCPGMDPLAGLQKTITGNAETFAEFGPGLLDMDAVEHLTQIQMNAVSSLGETMMRRRDAGFVKRCHGDLHLRNIC
ncbi:MAG: hypothetical protein ACTSV1_07865, partial [Alphaproteobacteria bacterium]